MEKADKITIRLTPEQASALDFLVKNGDCRNRSEAVRALIDRYIMSSMEDEGKVLVKLPDTMLNAVDMLISAEHFVNRELGIRELVRNGLSLLDIAAIQERHALLSEAGADKKAWDILEGEYSSMLKQ
jgi:metal-responsive CopG/Arc/MetJ family transcriptional regulator